MSQKSSTPSCPLLGLLGILFIGLKLTGHINWSWWWVLAPFWGGIGLYLVICLFVFAAMWARGKF